MTVKGANFKLPMTVLLLSGTVIFASHLAAGSAAIGLIARSVRTTVGGAEIRSQSTLFRGDALEVQGDGMAIVQLNQGGRMVLNPRTAASFQQAADVVTVNLQQGSLSLFQPERGRPLRVKAGDVSVEPVRGFPTLGEVAMRDGKLSVKAQRGHLRVNGRGTSLEATKDRPVILDVTGPVHASPGAAPPGAAGAAGSAVGKTVAIAAIGTGTSIGIAKAMSKEKNPNAVAHVAANVPEEACEHAASPSVPAVACQGP